jgi:polyisoprenoid-binding protein YceI
MKSADFFDVARFPSVTFKSDKLRFENGKPVAAEGMLTLLGVSKPVKLKIERFTCGENPIVKKALCAADIETTLKRSEFGMTKYLPGISDEVRVLVPVEAFRD